MLGLFVSNSQFTLYCLAFLTVTHSVSEDIYDVHEVDGKKLRLPKTALDAQYFVNIPKIKTEGHVDVTLSIKNLFGLPQRRKKSTLHGKLNEILPYLANTVRQDLIVVDGIVAMEGNGPLIGTPKELGIIVVGNNPISVDALCAKIMGYEPRDIKHLARAYDLGIGEIDIDRIEVLGDSWEKYASKFERPYSLKASVKSISSIRKVYFPSKN